MLTAILLLTVAGADWRGFRGDGSGVAPQSDPPLQLGASENVAWRAGLPGRGLASPIVVGDKVFVTCASGPDQNRLHVICFDARSGRELWHRRFWATGRTQSHPKTCVAAPTPVSDGVRVFALFSSNDLFALDLQGNLVWLRGLMQDYPNASNSLGLASSPVVAGQTLIVQAQVDSKASFAAGIDVANGVNRWKIERPTAANWTTPAVVQDANGGPLVLLQGGSKLSAHEPDSGREAWVYQAPCGGIPSSGVEGATVFVPSSGITALRATGAGAPEVLWKSDRLRVSTASPTVANGRLYALAGSILKCGDAKTGEQLWQLRLAGAYSATPVVAGGRVYCFNEEGLVQVVAGGPTGKVVGGGNLGTTILATPAVADDAIYIRSDSHLWKFAAGNARSVVP